MRIAFAREATLGMVARNTDADSARTSRSRATARRFFHWWQAWLSHLSRRFSDVVATSRVPPSPFARRRSRAAGLLLAGSSALLVGAVGAVALSTPGASRTAAITAAVMSSVWGAARLLLMRLAARGSSAPDVPALQRAWALGSLVWVIGVTPELRVLAWGLSGALTWVALDRSGASRPHTWRCVGIAWGGQAAVVAGSWLLRNALMAVLLGRG